MKTAHKYAFTVTKERERVVNIISMQFISFHWPYDTCLTYGIMLDIRLMCVSATSIPNGVHQCNRTANGNREKEKNEKKKANRKHYEYK